MADLNQPGEGSAPPELDALDRIGLEAAGQEADAAAAEHEAIHGADPEPVIDHASSWAQLPFMVGGILSMVLPELRGVYTEEKCYAWGQGMALVADKHGWDAGETMAKWGPECMLIAASVPLIVPTVQAIKARQAARKAKPLNNPPGQPENGAEGANNAPEWDANPMNQKPGGFSVPT
jgi:hypothetical protein